MTYHYELRAMNISYELWVMTYHYQYAYGYVELDAREAETESTK